MHTHASTQRNNKPRSEENASGSATLFYQDYTFFVKSLSLSF